MVLAGADSDDLPEYESHLEEFNDWLDTRIPVNRHITTVDTPENGPIRHIVTAKSIDIEGVV